MADRRTVDITIDDHNSRDHGKTYRITEMFAGPAEDWAMRAFFALGGAGLDIPEDVAAQGLAGLAGQALTSFAKIPWVVAKPLMDEMMTCVSFKAPAVVRPLMEEDIEEVSTRLLLRKEVLRLHVGFLRSAAGLS